MLFTEEHRALQETTIKFIDREIRPNVDEWEKEGIFPAHELFKKLGDAGLLGINKPEKYGGLGLDYSYEMAFAEALGHIPAVGISTPIGVQTNMCTPALAKHGSDELCKEYLIPAIAGDTVGCIGVSELDAGSDVASMKTYAKKDGDDYIINGSKMWITNATQADWMCMLCNTGTENGPHKNKSLIIVPLKQKGVSFSKRLEKMVLQSSDTAQVFFDNVRVPQRNLIGEEGRGFIYQMKQFQEERLFLCARTCLNLEEVIDVTIEYTKNRIVFGKPVLHNQVVHYKLAELKCKIEALRSLTYRAAEEYVSGVDVSNLTSMGKYLAGELAKEVPSACLQYWGGQGVLNDNVISRYYRDLRQSAIGGGASEIMLQIISRAMGTHP